MKYATHRKNLDGNLAALDRYLDEIDRRDAWEEAQVEVDDAVLEAEGKEPTPKLVSWLCDAEEFAETLATVKAHRAANKSGPAIDWDEDDCFFEHVHGVRDDRDSEEF